MSSLPTYTAFADKKRFAAGAIDEVALAVKALVDGTNPPPTLIFEDATGEQIDVDLRGAPADMLRQIHRNADRKAAAEMAASQSGPRTAGRPKLGVIAREVTLLPRHWQWLSAQPGGASVALRRLVEHASRAHGELDRVRQAQEAAYRFMSAMAGNEAGFEEATRALFAGHAQRFQHESENWPNDIRDYARRLAAPALIREHGKASSQ